MQLLEPTVIDDYNEDIYAEELYIERQTMSGKAFDKNEPFNINMLRYVIKLEFE